MHNFICPPFPFSTAHFLRTPSPLNVTEGEIAEFTCQAYGIAISWFVDDATVTTGNENFWFITRAGNGIVNSTLYAQASEQTHNSSMECVVYSAAIEPYYSGIVHLLVQGKPPCGKIEYLIAFYSPQHIDLIFSL